MANNYTAQILREGDWVNVFIDERFFRAIEVRQGLNAAYPDHSARVLVDGRPIEARWHPGGWAGWEWFAEKEEVVSVDLAAVKAYSEAVLEAESDQDCMCEDCGAARAYLSLLEAVAPLRDLLLGDAL